VYTERMGAWFSYVSDRWSIARRRFHQSRDRLESPSRFRSRWTSNGIRNRPSLARRLAVTRSVSFSSDLFCQCRLKFVRLAHARARAREREAHACGSASRAGVRARAETTPGWGPPSHPTWRFQFHFLSRRSSLPPSRPPCGSDLGSGVVSHPTPCYSLDAARGCKDREIHRSSGAIAGESTPSPNSLRFLRLLSSELSPSNYSDLRYMKTNITLFLVNV